MTDLDEIILVTKCAWALRQCPDLSAKDTREHFYSTRAGVDLRDYISGLRERLDRRALQSETIRRNMGDTNALS